MSMEVNCKTGQQWQQTFYRGFTLGLQVKFMCGYVVEGIINKLVLYFIIKLKKKHNVNIGVFGWQRRRRLEARACERERGPARRCRSRPDRGWRRHWGLCQSRGWCQGQWVGGGSVGSLHVLEVVGRQNAPFSTVRTPGGAAASDCSATPSSLSRTLPLKLTTFELVRYLHVLVD